MELPRLTFSRSTQRERERRVAAAEQAALYRARYKRWLAAQGISKVSEKLKDDNVQDGLAARGEGLQAACMRR